MPAYSGELVRSPCDEPDITGKLLTHPKPDLSPLFTPKVPQMEEAAVT